MSAKDVSRVQLLREVRRGAEAPGAAGRNEVSAAVADRGTANPGSVVSGVQQPAESRKTALATGAKRYVCNPCKRCGGLERYARARQCVSCSCNKDRWWKQPAQAERRRAASARHHARAGGHCAPVYGPGELHEAAGLCAVCGLRARRLDHDHTTGAVRGVLCDTCNRLRVGHAEAISPATVRYLARHGSDALTKLLAAIIEAQMIVAMEDANADL